MIDLDFTLQFYALPSVFTDIIAVNQNGIFK